MVATLSPPFSFATVPQLCQGGTVVCIGGGPSLTPEDVDACRGKAVVIVINDGYKLAPWAEALYACDARWWDWHKGVKGFAGLKYALQYRATKWPGVQLLNNTGTHGLERKKTGLRTGRNSGYQAINLAVHFGAQRIVLLGYDMQRTNGQGHWFGEHPTPQPSPLGAFRGMFDGLRQPLQELGITVTNCSRETALTAFPRARLEDVL